MTNLKPCPFCGEQDHLYPTYRMGSIGPDLPINIQCLGCGIEFTPGSGQSAIMAWNRRSSATPVSDGDQKDGGGRG